MKKSVFSNLTLLSCALLLSNCSLLPKGDLPRENGYKSYQYGIITGQKPIVWNTEEGIKLFETTKYKKPFYALVHHFASQQFPSTCGPASARIILSAIYENTQTQFPLDKKRSFYKLQNGTNNGLFTMSEENVFMYASKNGLRDYDTIAGQSLLKRSGSDRGMEIEELANVIATHPNVEVEMSSVNLGDVASDDLDKFRQTLKQVMSTDGQYIIANYHLGIMYNKKGGHFSPLVAYNEDKDMVLIMDVAGHLGTWVWVKLEELYRGMNSTLYAGGNRGYLIIKQTDPYDVKSNEDVLLVQNKEKEAKINSEK